MSHPAEVQEEEGVAVRDVEEARQEAPPEAIGSPDGLAVDPARLSASQRAALEDYLGALRIALTAWSGHPPSPPPAPDEVPPVEEPTEPAPEPAPVPATPSA